MFSSTNNNNVINPFPHLFSSSYVPPPPPPDQDSNGVFLHHHHDLLWTTSLLPSNGSEYPESLINLALLNNVAAATSSKHDDGGDGGLQNECFGGVNSSVPVKKPVKKDRHSKIQTAQGVRDRRVRLSIEIAREFFDLQDMLGFDKASKTLEWLLKKSRNAIKELVNMKHGGEFDLEGTTSPKHNSPDQLAAVSTEIVNKKRLQKPKVHLLAKESRAKARERARERTREKMRSPQLLRTLTQHGRNMGCSSSKVIGQQVEEFNNQNVVRESVMIKRKLKQSMVLGCDHQNVAVSKDGNNYFPNLSHDWDDNGAMSHSTFSAMTNVNLSAGDELYGKP